uniref:Uncharacterized protein n=1 Tax=Daucus carota subsp. sativus TaxID=79200 RepID=A0A161XQJ8_DAUCS
MERKYFHPFQNQNSQPLKVYHKKQKFHHFNNTSQNNNPRQPHVRNPNTSQNTQNAPTGPFQNVYYGVPMAKPSVTAPKCTLVDVSNIGKLDKMLNQVQPGMMVCVPQKGTIHGVLMAAKWDNMIFYRGQNFFVHLLGEFYANLVIQKGLDDVFLLHTVVHGKNMLIDTNTFTRALKLGIKTPYQPCVNIYEKFVFNTKEMELFLGFFCDCDVPKGLCDQNIGIDYRHFTTLYQQLAIIIRANSLPKPKDVHIFDFVDLKVMFQVVTNQIEFNVNYVIILNMIIAFQENYMPYGLLLTSVFELYHIPMPRILSDKVEYCNLMNIVRPQIPLKDCSAMLVKPVVIAAPAVVLVDKPSNNMDIKTEIEELKSELKDLKDSHEKLLARIELLEAKGNNNSTAGNLEGEDDRIASLFEDGMVHVMDAVEASGKDVDSLPDINVLSDDLGFVAVEGPTEK